MKPVIAILLASKCVETIYPEPKPNGMVKT